jgi:hypothetical protein
VLVYIRIIGARYYHVLVWVYLTWLVLVFIIAVVGLSNMVDVGSPAGWCWFI